MQAVRRWLVRGDDAGGGRRNSEFTAEVAEGAEDCNNDEDGMNEGELNVRTGQIVDAGMRVHSALGPGLLESAYEACLAHVLRKRGLRVDTQVALPVHYDGQRIEVGYRLDLVVQSEIVVEIKAVSKNIPVYEAQLLSYLRLGNFRLGLLMNFHTPHLKDGIKRIVNGL